MPAVFTSLASLANLKSLYLFYGFAIFKVISLGLFVVVKLLRRHKDAIKFVNIYLISLILFAIIRTTVIVTFAYFENDIHTVSGVNVLVYNGASFMYSLFFYHYFNTSVRVANIYK